MNTRFTEIAQLGSTLRVLGKIYLDEPKGAVKEEVKETMKSLLKLMFSTLRGKKVEN